MLPKRRYGYLLLVFLVFSGLAGTSTSDVLSKKERKFAADHMKLSRNDIFSSVKGLSEDQLNFKSSPDRWSVKECVYHIAISEKNLWAMLENSMKDPAIPEKRSEVKFTDKQVIQMIKDRSNKVKTFESFEPKNTPYKSIEEALKDFKTTRNEHAKYIKATSENLRNHFIQLPFGLLDCYQFCLFISAHSERHNLQIMEVKADASFPK